MDQRSWVTLPERPHASILLAPHQHMGVLAQSEPRTRCVLVKENSEEKEVKAKGQGAGSSVTMFETALHPTSSR